MAGSDVLEQAREYYSWGWSIIPVRHGEKQTYVKWEKFKHLRSGEEILSSWFNGRAANMAVVTGALSGILVVDVDNHDLQAEFETQYPTHLKAKTPRGGLHLYYKYPKDGRVIKNRQGFILGCDVRAEGGYCLLPPSFVRYEEIDYQGSYVWIEKGEPADLPEGLATLMTAERRTPFSISVNTNASHNTAAPAETETSQADLFKRLLVEGFQPGRHNEEVYQVACMLAGYGIPQWMATAILEKLDNEDPTPQGEALLPTISSAYSTAYKPNRNVAEREKAASKGREFSMDFVQMNPFDDTDYSVSWLVKDWVPEGSVLSLLALPESYKTWTLFDMGVAVALGKPFLGQYPVKQAPVLFIQQEDSTKSLKHRFGVVSRAAIRKYGLASIRSTGVDTWEVTTPDDIPFYLYSGSDFVIDDKEGLALDLVEKFIVEKGIKLVMIDPFYRVTVVAGDFFQSAAANMDRLKELREKYGVAFVLAHHAGKSKAASGDIGRSGAYGTTLLDAAFEGVVSLTRQLGEPKVYMTCSGKSYEESAYAAVEFDIESGAFTDGESFVGEGYEVTVTPLTAPEYHELARSANAARTGGTAEAQPPAAQRLDESTQAVLDLLREAKPGTTFDPELVLDLLGDANLTLRKVKNILKKLAINRAYGVVCEAGKYKYAQQF